MKIFDFSNTLVLFLVPTLWVGTHGFRYDAERRDEREGVAYYFQIAEMLPIFMNNRG